MKHFPENSNLKKKPGVGIEQYWKTKVFQNAIAYMRFILYNICYIWHTDDVEVSKTKQKKLKKTSWCDFSHTDNL